MMEKNRRKRKNEGDMNKHRICRIKKKEIEIDVEKKRK